ncbi:MIF-like protein mif-2 isoform X2 [Stylophora pistillata]|uniref:MIF-like protein mif-2 isoform X2 n=1 Tax=Stylophora pistillata TaxID=50429 RepID=UPI000C0406CB|nr:MIF-like protein mif-2 isoform X2 [Stylophora pistillata]
MKISHDEQWLADFRKQDWLIVQVVGVNVDAGARYTFGGTDDPAGVVNIHSAGSLAADKNNSSAKAISEHLQKHFNIPSGRLLIFFHELPRTHVGFNGKTLAS